MVCHTLKPKSIAFLLVIITVLCSLLFGLQLVWIFFYKGFNRPYAHDVISVGCPRLEVKRRLFIGQSCAPRVQICAFQLFRHRFTSKMAAGWRQCIRSMDMKAMNLTVDTDDAHTLKPFNLSSQNLHSTQSFMDSEESPNLVSLGAGTHN